MLRSLQLPACGGGGGSGTPTAPQATWFITTSMIVAPVSPWDTFDARLEFDGRSVAGCPATSAAPGICSYALLGDRSIFGIERGTHRMAFVVVSQVRARQGYTWNGIVEVRDGTSGERVRLIDVAETRTLRVNESISITVPVP